MAIQSAQDKDNNFTPDVPDSNCMIFRGRGQQSTLSRVKVQLIDRAAVAD